MVELIRLGRWREEEVHPNRSLRLTVEAKSVAPSTRPETKGAGSTESVRGETVHLRSEISYP